jgi:tRNA threonylcarbamoyladenosine biosynthesis protein TsaE
VPDSREQTETTTETAGAVETEALAGELARTLEPGAVVVVAGDLGAGKTTFVRGAVEALGASGPVTSPTFTIGQIYPGPVPVSHLDLYRLGSLDDEEPGLLDEYLAPDVIAFVEWAEVAERAGELERIAARVSIEHAGGDRRRISIARTAGDGGGGAR